MTRRWLRRILWLAALALLAGVLRSVPLAEVERTLARLGWSALLVLALANGLVLLALTSRWWLLLRAWGQRIAFFTLTGYRLAVFGVSYFTPGPQFGGEPLQVYLPHRHHRVPTDIAVAAVTLDKLLELLVNFSFLAGGVLLIAQQQLLPVRATGIMAAFSVGLLALPVWVLAMVMAGKSPLAGPIRFLTRLVSRWPNNRWAALVAAGSQFARHTERHIGAFYSNHPGTLLLAGLVSAIGWVFLVGEYWLMLRFLGAELTLPQTLAALVAARLAFLLPVPGALGALEASQVLAMSTLGIDPAIGLSVSLLIRLRDGLLGGLGLWWGSVKS